MTATATGAPRFTSHRHGRAVRRAPCANCRQRAANRRHGLCAVCYARGLCRHCGRKPRAKCGRGLCWGCHADREVRERYPSSRPPSTARKPPDALGDDPPDVPTRHPPGSEGKILVLTARRAAGLPLFLAGDAVGGKA